MREEKKEAVSDGALAEARYALADVADKAAELAEELRQKDPNFSEFQFLRLVEAMVKHAAARLGMPRPVAAACLRQRAVALRGGEGVGDGA